MKFLVNLATSWVRSLRKKWAPEKPAVIEGDDISEILRKFRNPGS